MTFIQDNKKTPELDPKSTELEKNKTPDLKSPESIGTKSMGPPGPDTEKKVESKFPDTKSEKMKLLDIKPGLTVCAKSEGQEAVSSGKQVMKYINLLAVLGFAFFVGCATTKAPTSQQRIKNVGRSFDDTDKQLSQAEKELKSFENSIAKIRNSAGGADRMRSKPEFDAAFARLSSRIEQTHLDLQELKTANARGRNTYDRQLDEAATEIQRSSAE